MKVLIVKTSALGDVVHALPVLAWLKSADPAMEIDWLVEEGFAPILEGHPLIRRVIPLRTKAWRKSGTAEALRGGFRTISALRGERYDLTLDLQGNSKSGLFTMFSGAPQRYGFARDGVREWPNLLATNRKVPLGEKDFHISDRSLAVARAAVPGGKDLRSAGPLSAEASALALVEKRLAEQGMEDAPLTVLHYGTTWDTKLWALDHWRELARRLCDDLGVRPVLTWGNDAEREAAEAIAGACDGRAIIWPRGSLADLTALLQRADLVVGGDTGPIHIAAAVGTATISLFRVTDAKRNGPRGERHIALQAPLDCSPCLRKECEDDAACARSIGVDVVLQSVRVQLELP